MREKYYTAREAATVLGLMYPTFLARIRIHKMYEYEMVGRIMLFEKSYIDSIRNEEKNKHAPGRRALA